ncbi:MAG: response regulator, partial [Oscillospiraceae bacterium]|nr:response regulator [Oscillospiraceae bacterium]
MKLKDKVLIVEDEQSISNFMSTILEANGFDTIVAATGAQARSMITSHCPDLIILDLGLPDMDGLEILREVRSWTSLPVIVVSA